MNEGPPLTQPSDRFVDAVAFAADVHRTQSRKGTTVPYLSHLLGVASLVLEDGGDEDQAIAALLHDVLEDSGADMEAMLQTVRTRFGDRAAELVEACTDVDVKGSRDRSAASWSARKQHTIDALTDADASVARVMVADKVHNVRAIISDLCEAGPQVWERFNAGRDDQLWYYEALAEAVKYRHARQRSSRLGDDLVRAVEQLRAVVHGSPPVHPHPSDWDPSVRVNRPCGAAHPISGRRCGRPAEHAGIHSGSPRPGDVER